MSLEQKLIISILWMYLMIQDKYIYIVCNISIYRRHVLVMMKVYDNSSNLKYGENG